MDDVEVVRNPVSMYTALWKENIFSYKEDSEKVQEKKNNLSP